MPGIKLRVDHKEWDKAADEWVEYAHIAGTYANLEAAQLIQKRTQLNLSRYRHAPFTHTTSPVGQPPAYVTGRLFGSIDAEHRGDDAIVGAKDSTDYGAFLEWGGVHVGHRRPDGLMWYFEDGRWYHAHEITKAPRHYFWPVVNEALASGTVERIYWRHWYYAQKAVTK